MTKTQQQNTRADEYLWIHSYLAIFPFQKVTRKLTRMMRQAGPMKLQMKWFSVLNQQL